MTVGYLYKRYTSTTVPYNYTQATQHSIHFQSVYTMHLAHNITKQLLVQVITLYTLHTWLPSVYHTVGREFHDCTSLQHGRIGLHQCLLYCQVLTVEIGQHIQTFYDNNCTALPWDIHSTLESRMMGRKVVLESSQLFLVLKCSTQHMGRCGHG